jgi:hypothetical protein
MYTRLTGGRQVRRDLAEVVDVAERWRCGHSAPNRKEIGNRRNINRQPAVAVACRRRMQFDDGVSAAEQLPISSSSDSAFPVPSALNEGRRTRTVAAWARAQERSSALELLLDVLRALFLVPVTRGKRWHRCPFSRGREGAQMLRRSDITAGQRGASG